MSFMLAMISHLLVGLARGIWEIIQEINLGNCFAGWNDPQEMLSPNGPELAGNRGLRNSTHSHTHHGACATNR